MKTTICLSRLLVLMAFLFAAATPVAAQKVNKLNRLADSFLSARYWRADIDTNYIIRPQAKWTLTTRLNISGTRIRINEVANGKDYELELKADKKATLNLGVSYMGLSLSLSLNPGKLMGKYKDYELGFHSYGKRLGFDFTFQEAGNFTGRADANGEQKDFTVKEGVKIQTLNANAYYVFNPRRFSYPAAFSHSYIQRRSAGSFLLAASVQGQNSEIGFDKNVVLKMTNLGIGAGYGYNYVPGKGWLLHISSLPTFIVYTKTSLTTDGNNIPLHYHFPEFIVTTRGSVVKQIGRNMFAGLSIVNSFTNIGDDDNLSIRNQKWLGHLYFGLRL